MVRCNSYKHAPGPPISMFGSRLHFLLSSDLENYLWALEERTEFPVVS